MLFALDWRAPRRRRRRPHRPHPTRALFPQRVAELDRRLEFSREEKDRLATKCSELVALVDEASEQRAAAEQLFSKKVTGQRPPAPPRQLLCLLPLASHVSAQMREKLDAGDVDAVANLEVAIGPGEVDGVFDEVPAHHLAHACRPSPQNTPNTPTLLQRCASISLPAALTAVPTPLPPRVRTRTGWISSDHTGSWRPSRPSSSRTLRALGRKRWGPRRPCRTRAGI